MFDPSQPITPTNTTAPIPNPTTEPAVTPTPAPEPAKVTFSREQQAKVDAIIKDVHTRIASDLRRDLNATKAELEQAKAERDRAVAAALPGATADEKLKVELDEQKRKNAELESRIQRTQRENLILAAARAHGFLAEDDALKFVEVPADADAVKIAEAVAQVASARPYLIRGEVKPGSGSGPASQIPPVSLNPADFYGSHAKRGAAEQLNSMSRSNPAAYRALRASAQKAGLI